MAGVDVEMIPVGDADLPEDPLAWEMTDEESGQLETGYWDLCLSFGDVQMPKGKEKGDGETSKKQKNWLKKQKERGSLLFKLKSVGLMLSKRVSTDKKTHFYLISAKQERLEQQAEIMELELKMQPKYGGGYAAYEADKREIFMGAYDTDFFSRTQRQQILRNIIEQDPYNGGADISIQGLLKSGTVNSFFPLHVRAYKKYLLQTWAHWRIWQWWKPQPLNAIRNYFGEELTLYFAWLDYYNRSLVMPTVLGIATFACQLLVPHNDGWPNVLFSIYMMFWTTMFLEFWKRKQNVLSFDWNTLGFEDSEESRPDYEGVVALGVHSQGQWIEFAPDDPALETVHIIPTKYYSAKKTKFKIFCSSLPLFLMLIMVFVVVLAILFLRLYLQRTWHALFGGIAGSVTGAVGIIIMNVVYKKLAEALNDWFFNTFSSLYYIAFLKSGFDWFYPVVHSNPYLRDGCKTILSHEDVASGNVIGAGCNSELMIQLFSLMALNLIIGQTKEIMIPLGKVQLKKLLLKWGLRQEDEDAKSMQTWESQSKLETYQGTFDEYAEMAIQYGLITVFSPAFPLAPMLALMNNFVELRTDAIKILVTNTKPWYKAAQDIGGWYRILNILSVIAVTTNALLLGLGYAAIPQFVGSGHLGTSFNTFVVCVVLEHLLLVGKYVLAEVVPDMPGDVMKALAKQEFLKNETLKELGNRPHFQFAMDEAAAETFAYGQFADGEIVDPDAVQVSYGQIDYSALSLAESKKKKKNRSLRKKAKKVSDFDLDEESDDA